MCGIAGIISTDPLGEADHSLLREMTARLAHRGPDGSGFHLGRHALLGHRRLAIIDLHGGGQPIANERATVHAVANGEFYNFLELRESLQHKGHHFRTAGDSECLVHLFEEHGESCVDHVSGMFAFALWDDTTRTALLARDRLGVKPLYYHHDGSRLIFGSELKAILASPRAPREIDRTALIDYLTFGYIPAPKTIFKGICKLPPATMLTCRDGRITIRQYWDLHVGEPLQGSAESVAEQVWHGLRDATRRRMVADVPVGAFLSAGIDSAAVVAAMASLARSPIDSVTCGFDEANFDERTAAAATAAKLGTRHHELLASLDTDDIAETLCRHFDEPFADASAIPTYFLSRETRRLVTVALSGDGGDEVCAGYRRYRFDAAEHRVRRLIPNAIRRGLLGPLGAVYPAGHALPRPLRAGATLRNLAVDDATGHGQSIATMDAADVNRLLAGSTGDYDSLHRVRELYHHCDAADHVSKCQYIDIRLGLADGILTKVDRASMAHALEVRSPMLDYQWIELAWRVPPTMRLARGVGKRILRKIVERKVDADAAHRPKTGFEVPLDAWFRGPLAGRFEDTLSSPSSAINVWLDQTEVRRLWNEHQAAHRNHGPTLWKIVMLDAWARMYLRSNTPHNPPMRLPTKPVTTVEA
ncbi:MAG: asparagine synthase (glutamine-hydrolyzing) [Planctomycetes bacterium]|nr:asparagine synthase (glutamine-hydrolyzing) [Planctomycetota bacterium]